jgi:hypothetical protein
MNDVYEWIFWARLIGEFLFWEERDREHKNDTGIVGFDVNDCRLRGTKR